MSWINIDEMRAHSLSKYKARAPHSINGVRRVSGAQKGNPNRDQFFAGGLLRSSHTVSATVALPNASAVPR